MRGTYEHKPRKEKKTEVPVHHCESCKHFEWGLITPYSDADGVCMFDPKWAKRKYHHAEACGHYERKARQ